MPSNRSISEMLREVDKDSIKVMEEINIEVKEGEKNVKINISTTSLKEKIRQSLLTEIRFGHLEWKDSYRG